MSPRTRIAFSGESGQGIDSIGRIVFKALVAGGFRTFAYREYPSLIKGGFACYQIDIADHPLKSPSREVDILVSISRYSAYEYTTRVAKNGLIIHSLPSMEFPQEAQDHIDANNIMVVHIDAEAIAQEAGGNKLMENVVLLGKLWKVIDLDIGLIEEELRVIFAKKPQLLEADIKCANAGFTHQPDSPGDGYGLKIKPANGWESSLAVDSNWAVAKGAVQAGVRAYYAYPMTPSSSVLTYLADWQFETKMVVKQIEDEISAAQFTLGSSFMGTRAMTGTSGGGFDLMSETISLAGITETPLVVLLAQRPGPATGLPTWTMAADLNLAVYAGHGEYPKIVLAASDPTTAYELTQHAHNLAEKHRTPVIILTEKQIAESTYNIAELGDKIPIERHLASKVAEGDYYHPDPTKGQRWLPGEDQPVYLANSDEHNAVGDSIEDAATVQEQYDRRMGKLPAIIQDLMKPRIFGNPASKTAVVGWGSIENGVHDYLATVDDTSQLPFHYVHFDWLWPLDADELQKLLGDKTIIAIENNYLGQLADLLIQTTGLPIAVKHTKYDGRAYYSEEIAEILEGIT